MRSAVLLLFVLVCTSVVLAQNQDPRLKLFKTYSSRLLQTDGEFSIKIFPTDSFTAELTCLPERCRVFLFKSEQSYALYKQGMNSTMLYYTDASSVSRTDYYVVARYPVPGTALFVIQNPGTTTQLTYNFDVNYSGSGNNLSGGTTDGAIAGIVIGVLAGVFCLVWLCALFVSIIISLVARSFIPLFIVLVAPCALCVFAFMIIGG